MPQIEVSESTFERAERLARTAGYANVDEMVECLLRGELNEEDLLASFTPERLTVIDAAARDPRRLSDADLDAMIDRARRHSGDVR